MTIHATIEQVYSGHADAVYCLERGPDSSTVYSGGGDGFVGSWDAEAGTFTEPVAKMPATIYSLLKHPDQNVLFSGLQNGLFFVLDLDGRSVIKSIQLGKEGLFDLAFLPEAGSVLVASGDGFIHRIDGNTFELVQSLNLTDKAIRCLGVSPCGRFVVAGSSDHHVYFLEFEDELRLRQVFKAHDNSVFTAVYQAGYSLLTGGRDALLRQWDWDKNRSEWIAGQKIAAHNFTVNKIAVQPGSGLVATASRDKTAKIWNAGTMELLKVLDLPKFPGAHTHSVNTLVWLNDHNLLTTGDDKRMIRWRIDQR